MKAIKGIFSAVSALFCVLAPVANSYADLSAPGEIQSSFESPNQVAETCSLPRFLDVEATLGGATLAYLPFSESQRRVSKVTCLADFHDRRESTVDVSAAVTCAKINSTNPGLMFHALPVGMSRATFIARECPKMKDRAGEQIAKFKQSISCSYTPSILAYPRIANVLATDVELPFTAYRSMDRRVHLEYADRARGLAARAAGEASLIAQNWRTLYRDDSAPSASPRRAALFKEEDSLIYGGLVPNLAGDAFYGAANGSTAGDRVANFQVTAAFQRVADARPISRGVVNAESIQRMVLLREMGDLIILDTLLNQQDRFGNLHYRSHYVRLASDGKLEWEAAKNAAGAPGGWDPEQAARMKAAGYTLIKRMLMTDNDCGVAKSNKMANANGGKGMAYKVSHLHPDTYRGLQRLQKLADEGKLAAYLKGEFLFRDADVKSVQANLTSLSGLFRKKCLDGTLHLDADLAQYAGVKPAVEMPAFCTAI